MDRKDVGVVAVRAEQVVGLARGDLKYSRKVRAKLVRTGGKNRYKFHDTYADLMLAQSGRETHGPSVTITRDVPFDVDDMYRRDGYLWRIATVCYRCFKEDGWTRIEPVREETTVGMLPHPHTRSCDDANHS